MSLEQRNEVLSLPLQGDYRGCYNTITGIDSELVEHKVGRPIQSLLSPNPDSREMMVASTRSVAVECYV